MSTEPVGSVLHDVSTGSDDYNITQNKFSFIGKNPGATIMTRQELLKLFCVLILITQYEFSSRSDLWMQTPQSPYDLAPKLGRLLSKNRFNELIASFRFSNQTIDRPEAMSSERYRWQLIDDFILHFNQHQTAKFIPSELICIDESMS
jgi:hypothetical protein